MSFFVIVIALIYATIQMIQLVTGSDPEILSYVKKDAFDPMERINLNDINFRMAFYVEDALNFEPR